MRGYLFFVLISFLDTHPAFTTRGPSQYRGLGCIHDLSFSPSFLAADDGSRVDTSVGNIQSAFPGESVATASSLLAAFLAVVFLLYHDRSMGSIPLSSAHD